jgi:hypothetical protein
MSFNVLEARTVLTLLSLINCSRTRDGGVGSRTHCSGTILVMSHLTKFNVLEMYSNNSRIFLEVLELNTRTIRE